MSLPIKLRKGSHRNTKCYELELGPHTLYWSYETCVAYRGPATPAIGMRLANHWGPTTGRHLREMGVYDLPIVSEQQFEAVLRSIYVERFVKP